MALNILLFVGSLALVLYASGLLAPGLDRIGSKLHLSDELLGILTALGADSPEISSAVVALMSNQRDLGVGIVLGSNLFNLAALLGLGAVVAGQVGARPAGTIFNGAVAVMVTLISGSLIIGFSSPVISTVLMLLVVIPYIYILAVGYDGVKGLPIPDSWKHFLALASKEVKEETGEIGKQIQQHQRRKRKAQGEAHEQSWKPALWVAPAIVAIVLGSIGLIKSATALGQGWLPDAVLGTFILAGLTGLPNSLTGIRLARAGRGAAVITETFNSNSINILVGLLLPAIVFGEGAPNTMVILDLCWLVLMTVTAVVLSAHSSKLTRRQGVALIALYFGFMGTWTVLFIGI